ncbi:MAG: hypothetical protein R3B70_41125 [Polyangiaceae bacterium]
MATGEIARDLARAAGRLFAGAGLIVTNGLVEILAAMPHVVELPAQGLIRVARVCLEIDFHLVLVWLGASVVAGARRAAPPNAGCLHIREGRDPDGAVCRLALVQVAREADLVERAQGRVSGEVEEVNRDLLQLLCRFFPLLTFGHLGREAGLDLDLVAVEPRFLVELQNRLVLGGELDRVPFELRLVAQREGALFGHSRDGLGLKVDGLGLDPKLLRQQGEDGRADAEPDPPSRRDFDAAGTPEHEVARERALGGGRRVLGADREGDASACVHRAGTGIGGS